MSWYKENVPIGTHKNSKEIVNWYLKSINKHQDETPIVHENEYQEKPCMNADCRYFNGLFNSCNLLTNKQRPCMQGD